MNRSTFLRSTLAATGLTAAATMTSPLEAAQKPGADYVEIRRYLLKSADKQALLESYLRDAAIPALNRAGVSHVGVFLPESPAETPAVIVILRHAALESVARCADILSDAALLSAGAAYLGTPAEEPVYVRMESWLTRGIEGMPALKQPAKGSGLYQLRIYESHSEKAAKKKLEMFNIGELAIFERCGLRAVFFGETLVGPLMPNLIYLLAFPDTAAKDQAWNTFRVDPEWAKLKTTPGFTDKEIVSHITNLLLVPAPYSQI